MSVNGGSVSAGGSVAELSALFVLAVLLCQCLPWCRE
jgi:hypothetical protein